MGPVTTTGLVNRLGESRRRRSRTDEQNYPEEGYAGKEGLASNVCFHRILRFLVLRVEIIQKLDSSLEQNRTATLANVRRIIGGTFSMILQGEFRHGNRALNHA